ncbi:hypothetical protein QQF64_036469 [Cirrhinus molitorella]|uniref:Uncharacterized protein n=1 Tax=Cirrhinus molitorella TaxID=172907 RepID=A0ABR3NJH9_9TELE
MTKTKLYACEQRWVSKLAPYSFEIEYAPGKLSVVADALGRGPFVRPVVSQRLLSEPYSQLLRQVHSVEDGSVQESFSWIDMERDVWDYVKKCSRCVFSETPELEEALGKTQNTLEGICLSACLATPWVGYRNPVPIK